MITKFSVTNFKSFNETFTLDFNEARGYNFNEDCVKNGKVNKAIIYGKNGVGKSNLGFAMFDLINSLTDKESGSRLYFPYKNAHSSKNDVAFKYEFFINNSVINYEYTKTNHNEILSEELKINSHIVATINRLEDPNATFNLKGTENLKTELPDVNFSILKYIKSNAVLEKNRENETFNRFFEFINGMLFFRSLDTNNYIGLETGSGSIEEDIITRGNVHNFEQFLNTAGIECKLSTIKEFGEEKLAFEFKYAKIPFFHIASQGTVSLSLFYFWLQRLKQKNGDVKFLFIDEFDAFYHHELAELVVEELKETNVQFILTTHNTSLMSNDLLRPDCYFLMSKERIVSLPNATQKELREAHNLEKMYKANSFNV